MIEDDSNDEDFNNLDKGSSFCDENKTIKGNGINIHFSHGVTNLYVVGVSRPQLTTLKLKYLLLKKLYGLLLELKFINAPHAIF